MMKYLRYARHLVLPCGIVGMGLRLWMLLDGTDEKGLYPALHIGWILLWLLTAAVLVCLWLITRKPGQGSHYSANFPPSLLSCIGYWIAAAGMVLFEVKTWLSGTDTIGKVACIAGILSVLTFLPAGWARYRGKAAFPLTHLFPCLFFALLMFRISKNFSAEPELSRFLLQFLALFTSAIACYQLWGFDADMGSRQKSLFWSLAAAYFCLVATPGAEVLYPTLALFHLTSHCTLQYLPQQEVPDTPQQPQTPTMTPLEEQGPQILSSEDIAQMTEIIPNENQNP